MTTAAIYMNFPDFKAAATKIVAGKIYPGHLKIMRAGNRWFIGDFDGASYINELEAEKVLFDLAHTLNILRGQNQQEFYASCEA